MEKSEKDINSDGNIIIEYIDLQNNNDEFGDFELLRLQIDNEEQNEIELFQVQEKQILIEQSEEVVMHYSDESEQAITKNNDEEILRCKDEREVPKQGEELGDEEVLQDETEIGKYFC